ncbi:hypothetical protein TWF694_004767 [Orbilia ellipsospora]|uniref:Uncharacterized protein n=1 Tax=Orbilia ellipsospora TaxID=2528407 RepID=A0AAV9WW93_9PEZI
MMAKCTITATPPPASASTLYKTIHHTCIEFLSSMSQDPSSPTLINTDDVRAVRTSDFEQTWGHRFSVSLHPQEYGTPLTMNGLVEHLEAAAPLLKRWDVEIEDVVVDEVRRKAVVRSTYKMQAKGASLTTEEGENKKENEGEVEVKEVVENDMVWMLQLDEAGERVEKAVEFKDYLADEKFKKTFD